MGLKRFSWFAPGWEGAQILAHTVPALLLWSLSCSTALFTTVFSEAITAAGKSFCAQPKGCFCCHLSHQHHQSPVPVEISQSPEQWVFKGRQKRGAQLVPVPLHPGTRDSFQLPLPPSWEGDQKGMAADFESRTKVRWGGESLGAIKRMQGLFPQ